MKSYPKEKLHFSFFAFAPNVSEVIVRTVSVLILWFVVALLVDKSGMSETMRFNAFVAVTGFALASLFWWLMRPTGISSNRTLAHFKVGSYAEINAYVNGVGYEQGFFASHYVVCSTPVMGGAPPVLVAVPDRFGEWIREHAPCQVRFVESSGQITKADLDLGIIPVVLADFALSREVTRPSAGPGVFQAQ